MVGDADVDGLDHRMREVGPCDDNIKDIAEVMRWLIDVLRQVKRCQHFTELLTKCVIWPVETDVYRRGQQVRPVSTSAQEFGYFCEELR